MKKLLRRSNLMAPVTSPELSSWLWWSRQDRKPDCEAWRHIPDAVTLDLEAGVLPSRKEEARGLVRQAIPMAGRGAVEVFVRPNLAYLQADLEAAVWPGLSGVMLPMVESPEQVAEVSVLFGGDGAWTGHRGGVLRVGASALLGQGSMERPQHSRGQPQGGPGCPLRS